MNQKIENQIYDQSQNIQNSVLSILQGQVNDQSEALITKKCDEFQLVVENKLIKMLEVNCLQIRIKNEMQINTSIKN